MPPHDPERSALAEGEGETPVDALQSSPPQPPPPHKPTTCSFCAENFPTRSALFRHLEKPPEHCLAPREDGGEKVMLILGYDCSMKKEVGGGGASATSRAERELAAAGEVVAGGDNAACLVLQAMGVDVVVESLLRPAGFSHASSIGSRSCPLLAQEPGVSATADTACLRAPTTVPLEGIRAWLDETNAVLGGTGVRLLGRMSVPPTFHAEIHAKRRRYEYLVPAWLFDETAEGPWPGPSRGQENLIPLLKHIRGRALRPFGHCSGNSDGRRRPCPLWHNFSASALPHSPSSSRRLYRFYACEAVQLRGSDYVCLSISCDAFVDQQVRGMVGLAVAAARDLISAEDIAACINPSRQEDLLPVPLAPVAPCSLAEIGYSSWQMKLGGVCMSPGSEHRSSPPLEGWSDETARSDAADFRRQVLDSAAGWWEDRQRGEGWLQDVLQPGALKLRRELEAANERAASSDANSNEPQPLPAGALLSPKEVPAAYAEVLRLLREADASGRWPSSTLARRLIISGEKKSGGSRARGAAEPARRRGHRQEEQSTAAIVDGDKATDRPPQETASQPPRQQRQRQRQRHQQQQPQQQQQRGGSFTVGAFPPPSTPPRGNKLFPELARAAFRLEEMLLPDRPPSTTIAVNSHAKFKPHVDIGAGAGQSRSLIVGLGDYVGGELVVEGEAGDIRYRPLEFNGWTERHWTRPFRGERYSLVWFTPKGCEGVTGDARFCVAVDEEETGAGGEPCRS